MKEVDELKNSINTAEAVRIGMASIQTRKGNQIYKRWHNRKVRMIKKLLGYRQETLWDKLAHKKSFKIGSK